MKYLSLTKLLLSALLLLSPLAHAEKTILVFGDSLSAGYGIAREAAWPQLLQTELQQKQAHYSVVNASIAGETTAGGVRRIAAALTQHKPDIVIVELGGNDGLRGSPLTEMRKNLSIIIIAALHSGAKVLLVGMRLPPNYGKSYVQQFQDSYPKLAKKHRVSLLPFLLDGVGPTQFQADNLHPVAEAQPLLLNNVMRSLQPLLK
ncbi:MAG: arylesterase [Gallionella sp.]